jgi:hypothetical protein
MKRRQRIKLPPEPATDDQIVKFLRSHDPEDLVGEGIMVIDQDHSDLEAALPAYLSEPRDARLSVPLPRTAKRILEELARRKAVGSSTLARIWIMEGLRREVRGAKESLIRTRSQS